MDFVKFFAPILLPLTFGAAFFTFVTFLVNRFDDRNDIKNNEKRLYELAYRRSEGFGRNIFQVIGPAILMWKNGEDNTVFIKIMDSLCNNYFIEKNEKGEWTLKPFPDFIHEAREEMEASRLEGDKDS